MTENPFEFGIIQRVRRWFGREPVIISVDLGCGVSADDAAHGLKRMVNEINSVLPEIKTDPPPMPECKPPKFRNGLTRIGTKVPPPPPEYGPKPAMPPPPPNKNTAWIDLDYQKHNEYLASLQEMLSAVDEAANNRYTTRAALIAVIDQWGPITFADETIEANKKKKISIKRENGFVKFSIGESNDQRTNGTAASVQRFSGDTGESGHGSTEGQLQADASEAPRCDSGRVWYDFKYAESDLPRD